MATTQIGTLTPKIDRHPSSLVSNPPITGPAARPRPAADPHTPMARTRSLGFGKTETMMAMATGLSNQPVAAARGPPVYRVDALADTGHSFHDVLGRLFRRPHWTREHD